jgi:succinate dehydrogenase / fumarate reductase iron-sulfur subunit
VNLVLHVWRQAGPAEPGKFERYEAKDISDHASFLEMLDLVNDRLEERGERPIAFEHDCREGICGSCGVVIDGTPHGPHRATTTCQLHMRTFKDGDEIWIEPWRARAFPVLKDLIVDRAAFDRIIRAGGYVSVNTGNAPDGNVIPVGKDVAAKSMDAAQCIACGACVAACPNASAMLFVSAKVAHLGLLPQGQPERDDRVKAMVAQMDAEGFGSCTNHGACQNACPKEIGVEFIALLNRDLRKSILAPPRKPKPSTGDGA